jgi:hypothetical protein
MGIARMIGVDESMNDPNTFSASILYVLPFVMPCWAILGGAKAKWRRLVVGYFGLSILCIILTGSRGAFVAMFLGLLLLVIRLKRRLAFLILAGSLCLSPIAWLLIPHELQNRFYTLIDPSVGPENAQESAESRGEGFWIGLELWGRYPLTGCGPGAWIPSTGRIVESHNLYGQVPGEMGLLGVLTFGSIALLLLYNTRAIKGCYRQNGWDKDFLFLLADAVEIAVILLLFMGYGGHNLFRFSWLWYGGFLIVARHLVTQRALGAGATGGHFAA